MKPISFMWYAWTQMMTDICHKVLTFACKKKQKKLFLVKTASILQTVSSFAIPYPTAGLYEKSLVEELAEGMWRENYNDEKGLHPNSGLIKYMERTKAAHLVSIRFPLMASSALFPDLELEATGCLCQWGTYRVLPLKHMDIYLVKVQIYYNSPNGKTSVPSQLELYSLFHRQHSVN